jgi:hypothetical protein
MSTDQEANSTETAEPSVKQNGDETVVEGPNAAEQGESEDASSEYDTGTAHAKDEGVTIKGKAVEDNGDGPRSKAELVIKGTGRNAEEALDDYMTAAAKAEEDQLLKQLHDLRKQVRSPQAEASDE